MEQILVFVVNFSLLDCLQSGFRSKYGTTTAMLKVTRDIQFSCNRKLMTALLLLDFSKACDNVVHSLLCSKLSSLFRFHGTAVVLIRSYFSDRYQCVCVDGKIPDLVLVARRVAQGLVLGPLLFSLFINDIASLLLATAGTLCMRMMISSI
jgi:hypothetical protein